MYPSSPHLFPIYKQIKETGRLTIQTRNSKGGGEIDKYTNKYTNIQTLKTQHGTNPSLAPKSIPNYKKLPLIFHAMNHQPECIHLSMILGIREIDPPIAAVFNVVVAES